MVKGCCTGRSKTGWDNRWSQLCLHIEGQVSCSWTYFSHELATDRTSLIGEGRREHHDLLLSWSGLKHSLDLPPHVCSVQHLIALVDYEVLHSTQIDCFLVDESKHPTRSANHNLWSVLREKLTVELERYTAKDHFASDIGQVLGEPLEVVVDLVGKLSSVAEHHHLWEAGIMVELLEGGQHKHL